MGKQEKRKCAGGGGDREEDNIPDDGLGQKKRPKVGESSQPGPMKKSQASSSSWGYAKVKERTGGYDEDLRGKKRRVVCDALHTARWPAEKGLK